MSLFTRLESVLIVYILIAMLLYTFFFNSSEHKKQCNIERKNVCKKYKIRNKKIMAGKLEYKEHVLYIFDVLRFLLIN